MRTSCNQFKRQNAKVKIENEGHDFSFCTLQSSLCILPSYFPLSRIQRELVATIRAVAIGFWNGEEFRTDIKLPLALGANHVNHLRHLSFFAFRRQLRGLFLDIFPSDRCQDLLEARSPFDLIGHVQLFGEWLTKWFSAIKTNLGCQDAFNAWI